MLLLFAVCIDLRVHGQLFHSPYVSEQAESVLVVSLSSFLFRWESSYSSRKWQMAACMQPVWVLPCVWCVHELTCRKSAPTVCAQFVQLPQQLRCGLISLYVCTCFGVGVTL